MPILCLILPWLILLVIYRLNKYPCCFEVYLRYPILDRNIGNQLRSPLCGHARGDGPFYKRLSDVDSLFVLCPLLSLFTAGLVWLGELG